jgi:uncharacterized iron-regulated membrane protein
MTEKQLKSGLRLSHRWVGLAAAALLLVSGVTGVLLQHPSWLGSVAAPSLTLAADPLTVGRLLRGNHWGVEESTDAGLTWNEVAMLAPPTDVVRIVFSGPETRTVHALGKDALVVSDDGGRVWEGVRIAAPGLDPGVTFLDFAVGSPGQWHVLTDAGMLTSTDKGRTWAWAGLRNEVSGRDWHRLVHDLHTGHLAGSVGRRTAEIGALALLFITVTGLLLFRRGGRLSR